MVPTYDTIINIDIKNANDDKLILSDDEIAERLTQQQYTERGLSSGGQNIMSYPEKLFYKNQRLYSVKDGRLFKKKHRGILTKKEFPPWFFKIKD